MIQDRIIEGGFLVDAHVHYYRNFGALAFFGSAVSNFRRAARETEIGEKSCGWLLLTEAKGSNFFAELPEHYRTLAKEGWSLQSTEEDCSMIVGQERKTLMVLVSGRQIVTAEGLEVLAVCSGSSYDDGIPFMETVRQISDQGDVPVIPWGFGKWTLGRGTLLRQSILGNELHGVHLGDNGGRPAFIRLPRLFKTGAIRGMLMLPGSDPLPFRSQVRRVGSFGFVLNGRVNVNTPVRDFKRLLQSQVEQPRTFGTSERAVPFIMNQVAMQFKKRRR